MPPFVFLCVYDLCVRKSLSKLLLYQIFLIGWFFVEDVGMIGWKKLRQRLPQFDQGVPLRVLGQVFRRRLLRNLLHGGVQFHRLLLKRHQVQVLRIAHLQFPENYVIKTMQNTSDEIRWFEVVRGWWGQLVIFSP